MKTATFSSPWLSEELGVYQTVCLHLVPGDILQRWEGGYRETTSHTYSRLLDEALDFHVPFYSFPGRRALLGQSSGATTCLALGPRSMKRLWNLPADHLFSDQGGPMQGGAREQLPEHLGGCDIIWA